MGNPYPAARCDPLGASRQACSIIYRSALTALALLLPDFTM